MTTENSTDIDVFTALAALGASCSPDLQVARTDDVAAQGDVLISRARVRKARTPIHDPIAVVEGEHGGNAHTLYAEGACYWDEVGPALKLGVLTVAAGARAFLFHAEHGALEIAPGTYRVGRQRELGLDTWQLVQD